MGEEGHAAHFLSRLDRFSRTHVELALSLYNDVEMLREILSRAAIAEGAERVCISLDDTVRGPFLVVTRDGHFVTCLGEGMSPGPHPVISRSQLDTFATKMVELRHKIRICREVTGKDSPTERLYARVLNAGMNLGREEFLAVSMWTHTIRSTWFKIFGAKQQDIRAVLPACLGITKMNGRNADLLEGLWNSVWALGHIAMLLAPEARAMGEILEAVPAEAGSTSTPLDPMEAIGRSVAEWSTIGLVARASYWAARAGKYALAGYKRYFSTAYPFHLLGPQAAGLTAIGLRHQRLRHEVRKALGSHVADAPEWNPAPHIVSVEAAPGWIVGVRHILTFVRERCDDAFDRPDEAMRAHREDGRALAAQLFSLEPAGSAHHYASKEEIPDDIALPTICNLNFDVATEVPASAFYILPWLARAKPEDLYLPKEARRSQGFSFRPEFVLEWLKAQRERAPKRRPLAATKTPGRNEPCSCGSGKKYKRCCGR